MKPGKKTFTAIGAVLLLVANYSFPLKQSLLDAVRSISPSKKESQILMNFELPWYVIPRFFEWGAWPYDGAFGIHRDNHAWVTQIISDQDLENKNNIQMQAVFVNGFAPKSFEYNSLVISYNEEKRNFLFEKIPFIYYNLKLKFLISSDFNLYILGHGNGHFVLFDIDKEKWTATTKFGKEGDTIDLDDQSWGAGLVCDISFSMKIRFSDGSLLECK